MTTSAFLCSWTTLVWGLSPHVPCVPPLGWASGRARPQFHRSEPIDLREEEDDEDDDDEEKERKEGKEERKQRLFGEVDQKLKELQDRPWTAGETRALVMAQHPQPLSHELIHSLTTDENLPFPGPFLYECTDKSIFFTLGAFESTRQTQLVEWPFSFPAPMAVPTPTLPTQWAWVGPDQMREGCVYIDIQDATTGAHLGVRKQGHLYGFLGGCSADELPAVAWMQSEGLVDLRSSTTSLREMYQLPLPGHHRSAELWSWVVPSVRLEEWLQQQWVREWEHTSQVAHQSASPCLAAGVLLRPLLVLWPDSDFRETLLLALPAVRLPITRSPLPTSWFTDPAPLRFTVKPMPTQDFNCLFACLSRILHDLYLLTQDQVDVTGKSSVADFLKQHWGTKTKYTPALLRPLLKKLLTVPRIEACMRAFQPSSSSSPSWLELLSWRPPSYLADVFHKVWTRPEGNFAGEDEITWFSFLFGVEVQTVTPGMPLYRSCTPYYDQFGQRMGTYKAFLCYRNQNHYDLFLLDGKSSILSLETRVEVPSRLSMGYQRALAQCLHKVVRRPEDKVHHVLELATPPSTSTSSSPTQRTWRSLNAAPAKLRATSRTLFRFRLPFEGPTELFRCLVTWVEVMNKCRNEAVVPCEWSPEPIYSLEEWKAQRGHVTGSIRIAVPEKGFTHVDPAILLFLAELMSLVENGREGWTDEQWEQTFFSRLTEVKYVSDGTFTYPLESGQKPFSQQSRYATPALWCPVFLP